MGASASPIDEMDAEELDVLEAEVLRQSESVIERAGGVKTRATILVGTAGVLGGTELVTASGDWLLSAASLAVYFIAAVLGLLAIRSSMGSEPDTRSLMTEYAGYSAVSLRRAVILSHMSSHDKDVLKLGSSHRLLSWGFGVLILAWTLSGVGTVVGLTDDGEDPPLVVRIEGGT